MLVDAGPETANCVGEIETPVMLRVAVPVFLKVTVCEELAVLMTMEPNVSDVGVTEPWAVGALATVSVKVTDPDWPLPAHARRMT